MTLRHDDRAREGDGLTVFDFWRLCLVTACFLRSSLTRGMKGVESVMEASCDA